TISTTSRPTSFFEFGCSLTLQRPRSPSRLCGSRSRSSNGASTSIEKGGTIHGRHRRRADSSSLRRQGHEVGCPTGWILREQVQEAVQGLRRPHEGPEAPSEAEAITE